LLVTTFILALHTAMIVRIVSVLDIASLSIPELLEYNLTLNDINYALINGVIAVDKSAYFFLV